MIAPLLFLTLALITVPFAAKAVPPAAGPQSAAHALVSPGGAQALPKNTSQMAGVLPTSLVWQDGERAFYSSAVNAISATATVGHLEWLATAMGLKRVDLLNHQVRHFTRLDGLPGDRVVAVAATGPDVVYCVSQITGADASSWAVCRFEAARERWSVEQVVSHPDYPAPEDARAFLAHSQGAVYFAPDVSLTDADPLLLVRDSRSSRWRGVTPSPVLRAGIGPLHVLSLHVADDGSAWLGTDHGLWHYAPSQDKWTCFLSTEPILLTAVHGDDVWAVESVLSRITLGGLALQSGPPGLVRLSTATQRTQFWPFPPRTSPSDSWAGRPATLAVGNDGRVWTCEGDTRLGPGRRFCVFDPTVQQWQTIPADGSVSLASIPDAVLPLPLPAASAPSYEYMRRFPEWFCPNEPGPIVPQPIGIGPTFWSDQNTGPRSEADRYQPIFSERDSHYPTQIADPGGVTWSLAHNMSGDYAVIRTGRPVTGGTSARDVYPWPGVDIATNPAIYTVGYVGGVLLVTTENKDWAVNPVRETWAMTDLWRTQRGGFPRRIIPQGDHAWVGDGQAVVRYDPKTGRSRPRFESKYQPQVEQSLLAVTGVGRLWLVRKNYRALPWERLYRVEPGRSTPVEVSLTLPPALRPTPRDSQMYVNGTLEVTPLPTTPDPIAVSETPTGELVWCVGWMTLQGRQVVCLIGYNATTRRWITPQPAGWSDGDLNPIMVGHQVYLPVPGGGGAVWAYDTLTGKWSNAAEPLPNIPDFGTPSALTMISVSPRAIWCLGKEMLCVCRYDRQTKVWSVFPCPVQSGGDARTDKVARVGDAFFVASREGLWRFDVRKQTWRRLPVPGHEREIEFVAGDTKSLWGKTRQGVARFDKATRQWKTFDRPDDSPEGFVSNDLAVDGNGAWLYGNSPAYRLDLLTGKWTDMTSEALADPLLTLLVQDVVPDGRWVWLLPADVRVQHNIREDTSAPLLGRYDVLTRQMDWYGGPGHLATNELPAGPNRPLHNRAAMMLVESDVVWVATQTGVYRYDKTAQNLSRFQVPPQFPLPANFAPDTVVRDGDALWLLGGFDRLRWVP